MTTTPALYRATVDGVCTSLGGFLADGDDYTPQIVGGVVHPEDQAHIDAGRLVPADDRKVSKDGVVGGKAPEISTPAASAATEA